MYFYKACVNNVFLNLQDNEIIQAIKCTDQESLQHDVSDTENNEVTYSIISEDWEQSNIMLDINRKPQSTVDETLETVADSQVNVIL